MKSKGEIRFAVIGCGRRAPAYPRTIKAVKGAKLVALCDKVGPLVKGIKKLADDDSIREYTDHRKMLKEGGFDAVIVVTEPEYQASLSVEAMEAGYDVYSDVPVTFSLEDCWKLVVTVERTKKVYYLGEQMRHTLLMRYWRELVRGGALGTVLFAEGHYIHAMACDRFWRNSETGELLTWEQAQKTDRRVKTRMWSMRHPVLYGPHELSPLLKVLDDRVASVSCYSTGLPNKRWKEIPFPCQFEECPRPDMEVALMFTEKGTILRFGANFSSPVSQSHWYHLLGTKGEIETRRGSAETGYSYFYPTPVMHDGVYHFARTPEPWFYSGGRPSDDLAYALESEMPEALRSTSASRATGHGGMDFYPVADFVNCLLTGDKPYMDVYEAVDTAAPCILAVKSAESGGDRFTVPDFRPNKKRKPGEMPEHML